MSSESITKNNKLTTENWDAFSWRFMAKADESGYRQLIDPLTAYALMPQPPETNDLTDFTKDEYIQTKEKYDVALTEHIHDLKAALSFLAQHLSDSVVHIAARVPNHYPIKMQHPADIWHALKTHGSKSLHCADAERNYVKSLKMAMTNDSKRDLEDFIKEVMTATTRLHTMGITFSNSEELSVYVNGLNAKYNVIKAPTNIQIDCNPHIDSATILSIIRKYHSEHVGVWHNNFNPHRRYESYNRNRPRNLTNYRNGNGNGNGRRDKVCDFCKAMGFTFDNHTTAECGRKTKANAVIAGMNENENKGGSSYFFLADSAATADMSPFSEILFNYVKFKVPKKVILGDNHEIDAVGYGTMVFESEIDGQTRQCPFYNTLHVPKLKLGLISIPIRMKDNMKMIWDSSSVHFESNNQTILKATLDKNNLLKIHGTPLNANSSTTQFDPIGLSYANMARSTINGMSFLEAHRILGHLGPEILKKTIKVVKGIHIKGECSLPSCADCKTANSKQKPHPHTRSSELADSLWSKIHSDLRVYGTPTLHGELYQLLFIDDKSREVIGFILKEKTGKAIYECFMTMVAQLRARYPADEISSSFKHIISIWRTDNDPSFNTDEFNAYFTKHGINHQFSGDYDHPQNGVSERMNRSLGEIERAFREYAEMPIEFWGYSSQHAVFIKNNTWSSAAKSNSTPIQISTGAVPDLNNEPIWGCAAVVHSYKEAGRKNGERHGRKCRYLGKGTRGTMSVFYECSTGKIIESNDFDHFNDWKSNPTCITGFEITSEHGFSNAEQIDNDSIDILPVMSELPVPSVPKEKPIIPPFSEISYRSKPVWNEPGVYQHTTKGKVQFELKSKPAANDINAPPTHSKRKSKMRANLTITDAYDSSDTLISNDFPSNNAPAWWGPDATDQEYDFDAFHAFKTSVSSDFIPRTPSEARRLPDWPHYRDAMKIELQAHSKNGTWKKLSRSKFLKRKTIKCRWVFAKKYNHDGTLHKYKARLVARGFTQRHGIDYEATFAPTLALKSFRTLVALAAAKRKKLYHADVPTAFVRADLNDEHLGEILMEPPEIPDDVELPENWENFGSDDILQLLKSLYGLKQAPRKWYTFLRDFLVSIGFSQSKTEPCVYTLRQNSEELFLGVFVDDLLYFGDDNLMKSTLSMLEAKFNITPMGLATWFLGIHIDQSDYNGVITLDQSRYITEFLEEFGLSHAHPVSTALPTNYVHVLKSEDSTQSWTSPYSFTYNEAVGKLMYAMVATRPDLCASVGILSRYLKNPCKAHWTLLLHTLKYLASSVQYGICFRPTENYQNDITPFAASDSDHAQDPISARSVSGFIVMMCNGPIAWYSKKQTTTAQSSAESELIALNACTRTSIWLRHLLTDLFCAPISPTIILEDNQSCIQIALHPQLNDRTAHIKTKFHYVNEVIEDGSIAVQDVRSTENVADFFTKGLPKNLFIKFRTMLGCIQLRGSVAA